MKMQHGFTLTELILVLAIGGILAAMTIPGMQSFARDQRISTQTNELIAALYYARSEAIKRNRRVTVCKTKDGATCNQTVGDQWRYGWLVFEDTRGAAPTDPADGILQVGEESVLRVHDALTADLQLTFDNNLLRRYVSYIPRGVTQLAVPDQTATQKSQSGVFRMCDDRGIDNARGIVISQTGRVFAVAPPDASAIVVACPSPCGGSCQ